MSRTWHELLDHPALSRPPDIAPLTSAGLGMVCILGGLAMRGGLGGGMVGSGFGFILLAAWDAFRILYLARPEPTELEKRST